MASIVVLCMAACNGSDGSLLDYSGCHLHFVNDNHPCGNSCGASLEYRYDTNGKVALVIYIPAGTNVQTRLFSYYTFEGDTLRASNSQDGYVSSYNYYVYTHGVLTRTQSSYLEPVEGDSASFAFTNIEYDVDGNLVHKIHYYDSAVTREDWYFYEEKVPVHARHWAGATGTDDFYYQYDDKVNPEALLGIYPDDPVRSFPHNITSLIQTHNGAGADTGESITYQYDASGLPISSSKYLYTYDCK